MEKLKKEYNLTDQGLKEITNELRIYANVEYVLNTKKDIPLMVKEHRNMRAAQRELERSITRFKKISDKIQHSLTEGTFQNTLMDMEDANQKMDKSLTHLNRGIDQLKNFSEELQKDTVVRSELKAISTTKKKLDLVLSRRFVKIRSLFKNSQDMARFFKETKGLPKSISPMSPDAIDKRISRTKKSKN